MTVTLPLDTAGESRELLETLDVVERLRLALSLQRERLAELQVRRRIRDDVESGAQKQQREYFLRKQLDSIRKELGEDDGSVIDEYRRKIEEASMPDEVREQAERELGRLDRMEVIRFDGYTVDEKVAIARGYLWPRQRERNGLREDEVEIPDELIELVVTEYTREAGVRQLERELGKLLRKTATQIASGDATPPITVDEALVRDALGRQRFWQESAERTAVPGVATGLAVTGTGGDVLFIEATRMDGEERLTLTGQLGDVMKESAQIALSWVRAHADDLELTPDALRGHSFHVHVPAGAIPKDGPSAGIAMTTALASLLTDRPVKHTVGMTGEVTLQGRVLPIGGLKQKVLAAHAAGLTDVVIPERNRADLEDVPDDVREELMFHPVMTLDEVLSVALEPARADALQAGENGAPG